MRKARDVIRYYKSNILLGGKKMTQPEKKFRAGNISATIWKNEQTNKDGKAFEYFSVSLDRNYTDKDGNWKSTNSFRALDLPKAALVLQKAHEFIVMGISEETREEIVI